MLQRDRPQVDLDHPVDDRDQEEEARPLRLGAAAGRAGRRSPRSYSRATLIAAIRNSTSRKRRRRGRSAAAVTSSILCYRSDVQSMSPSSASTCDPLARSRAARRRGPARARRGRTRGRPRARRPACRRSPAGRPRTGCAATATALPIANAQRPPISDRERRRRAAPTCGTAPARCGRASRARTPSAISPRQRQRAVARDVRVDRRAAPTPSRTSARPAHESGRTEKPKSAQSSETAPSAPGRTTPGWKISKPIPAMPARKSSETMFGSISVERKPRQEARARRRRSRRPPCAA